MTDSRGVDKLRVLLPHWAHHTEEHVGEMLRWRAAAEAAGGQALVVYDRAIADMRSAASALQQVIAVIEAEPSPSPP